VRESVTRAPCAEKGEVGGSVKGGASGFLRCWHRREAKGGGSGGGVCHAVRLGRAPPGHRGGRRPAPALERQARVACGRQSKIGDARVASRWGPDNSAGRRRLNLFRIQIQTNCKSNSNRFKLGWPKKDLPELKKFEIKYACEGLEEVNNFLHRNFSRFKMDFN
jgi:hypothetical protein